MALNPNIAKAIARRQVNELRENNKLIADFMGKDHELNQCISAPLYHKEWNWLMPVVEKIETLGYTFEKNYQRVDKDWQSLIVKGNDILYQEFNDDSLKSSYYVVVEFIKWYNSDGKVVYPFNEGDDYWTIEDGDVVWSCWDSVSEELYDENPNKKLFKTEQEAIDSLKN
jgi:hypothetical protein